MRCHTFAGAYASAQSQANAGLRAVFNVVDLVRLGNSKYLCALSLLNLRQATRVALFVTRLC